MTDKPPPYPSAQVRLTMDNISQLMFSATPPRRLGPVVSPGMYTSVPTGTASPVPYYGTHAPPPLLSSPSHDTSVMAQYMVLARHAAGVGVALRSFRTSTALLLLDP